MDIAAHFLPKFSTGQEKLALVGWHVFANLQSFDVIECGKVVQSNLYLQSHNLEPYLKSFGLILPCSRDPQEVDYYRGTFR